MKMMSDAYPSGTRKKADESGRLCRNQTYRLTSQIFSFEVEEPEENFQHRRRLPLLAGSIHEAEGVQRVGHLSLDRERQSRAFRVGFEQRRRSPVLPRSNGAAKLRCIALPLRLALAWPRWEGLIQLVGQHLTRTSGRQRQPPRAAPAR